MLNWIVWNRNDYLNKMDLALNSLQRFICHKTQTTNHLKKDTQVINRFSVKQPSRLMLLPLRHMSLKWFTISMDFCTWRERRQNELRVIRFRAYSDCYILRHLCYECLPNAKWQKIEFQFSCETVKREIKQLVEAVSGSWCKSSGRFI